MNLRVTGIRKVSPAFVTPPGSRHIAALGIGRQIIDVAIATCAEDNCVCRVCLQLSRGQITNHNSTSNAIHNDEFQHLATSKDIHFAQLGLPHQGLVGPQQQLLTGLTTAVERTRNLSTTKGPVCQRTTILSGERNALSHTLVNDVAADLRQTIDVGLTRPVIAPFDRVIEQSPDTVPVIRVVLSGVDTTLSCNTVSTSRTVLKTERIHLIT